MGKSENRKLFFGKRWCCVILPWSQRTGDDAVVAFVIFISVRFFSRGVIFLSLFYAAAGFFSSVALIVWYHGDDATGVAFFLSSLPLLRVLYGFIEFTFFTRFLRERTRNERKKIIRLSEQCALYMYPNVCDVPLDTGQKNNKNSITVTIIITLFRKRWPTWIV